MFFRHITVGNILYSFKVHAYHQRDLKIQLFKNDNGGTPGIFPFPIYARWNLPYLPLKLS